MKKTKHIFLLLVLCGAFLAAAAGCKTDSQEPYECTRMSELLDQRTACFNDDDCPCGAHCSLGICAYECLAGSECTGGTKCDFFGRCVGRDTEGLVLTVDSEPQGTFSVEPFFIEFLTQSEVRTLVLRVLDRDPGPVRIEAQEGLEVRCDSDDAFFRECLLYDLSIHGGIPQRIEVRVAAAMPRDEDVHLSVTIFSGKQRESVGVRLRAPAAAPLSRPSGIYQGYARFDAAGLSSRSQIVPIPQELTAVHFPITATVFPDSGDGHIIALQDELRAIFPEAETVGLLTQTSGSWSLDLNDLHYLGPAAPGSDDVEIVMSTDSRSVYWAGENLTATLRVTYRGAALDAYAPYVIWKVAMAYSEALPDGTEMPSRTPAYAAALDPARASDPLAIEDMVLARLPADLGATQAERAAAALCTPADAEFPEYLTDTIAQVEGVNVASGDLACEGLAPQETFGVLSTNLLTVNDTITTCIDDLGKVQEALDGDPTVVLTTDGCLDAGRVITALGLALQTDRDRAMGTVSTPDFTATAVAHRILQQWSALHGFMGRETMQVHKMNDILSEAERASMPFTIAGALGSSLAGWDLFLQPRMAVAMVNMPPEALSEPDYRYRFFPDAELPLEPSYDQAVGLAASILAVLRIQADVLRSLIADVRNGSEDYEDVEPVLTDYLRKSFILFAVAQGMYESARTLAEPGWQSEWELGLLDFRAALEGILLQLDSLDQGLNPLGIGDDDLPLYRIGDEVTAAERFSALSDYLLGAGTDFRAVAPYMVTRAQTALDDARDAWVANLDWNLTVKLDSLERSRRLEGVNRKYGEEIISLCGNPTWTSDTVLQLWNQIDPDTCFYDENCGITDEQYAERLTTARLGYNLCLTAKLRQRLGPNITSGDPDFDAVLDEIGMLLGAAGNPFPIYIYESTADSVIVYGRETGRWELPTQSLRSLRLSLPNDLSAQFIVDAITTCASSREATSAQRPPIAPASCMLSDECPVDTICSAGACAPDVGSPGADNPECYYGSLGEVAMAIMGAAKEIEIARSEYAEYTERYDIAMKSCIIAQVYHDQMETALADHNDTMHDLGAGKLAADIASYAAAAAKDACNIGNEILSGGGVAAAAAAEAASKSVSAGLQFAMDEAERKHEEQMMALENAMDEAICLNDATMELVGAKTAALRIQEAQINLSGLLVEFKNLKNSLRSWLGEGHTAVSNETDRRLSPLGADFWLDEKIEIYRDYMRQAKRVVYLTVLAVEYEFQLSSNERFAVLNARTPMDLQNVIDNLRGYAMTGTVGGASPSNLFTVVSLRDHLMQIADRSDFPEGWHALSEGERFRLWLTSPSHAVYDESGAYLGQELGFSIQPLGVIGMGETNGIPILAGTDCAERLWSVNASLLGEDLFSGGDTTLTRVVLKKRNTFFSQWCSASASGSPWQVASTRPSRNLFLDPYDYEGSLTSSTPVPDTTTVDEVHAFSNARISAYFNIPRAELEDESYFNGDSQELAGRGLYGDYTLFFPAETLSLGGGDGLVLSNIEDVLIRLDYISVAK